MTRPARFEFPNPPPVLGNPNFGNDAQGYLGAFPALRDYIEATADWYETDFAKSLPNGTAALPSLAFTSQANTGLYRPATSVLALSVNGTERARFTTSGMQLTGLLTGTAVTQSATDTTAGRVIRVQDGYVKGSILGTVSQSSGVPTGAIIQRGSNANGEFVRFADGTQIAYRTVDSIPRASVNGFFRTVSFAAAFADSPVVTLNYGIAVDYDDANMGPMRVNAVSTTQVSIIAVRGLGAPDVPSGATLTEVNVTAIGRWF